MPDPVVGDERWLRRERFSGVLIAVVLLLLDLSLPERIGAPWRPVAFVVELALIAALLVVNPFASRARAILQRRIGIVLIVTLSVSNVATLIAVVMELASTTSAVGGSLGGGDVLRIGLTVWCMNIALFTLWYWELDGGGPALRAHGGYQRPSFLWPQLQAPRYTSEPWLPHLGDYLALAAFTSLSFAPSDTPVLRVWAKLAMALQAAVSFGLAGLVVARAINILGS